MEEPTKAQIKEFWEWCGFKLTETDIGNLYWAYPDGQALTSLPPIDLNNLFKYAMPKLKGRTRIHFSFNPLSISVFEEVGSGVSPLYYEHRYDNQEDPALALFWAIWEVKDGI